jgi:glucokinase
MSLLAIDLGGTKLAVAVFTNNGDLLRKQKTTLDKREGADVGRLIISQMEKFLEEEKEEAIQSIGISIPGIYHSREGTVWAPNIPGWSNYPLLREVQAVTADIPVSIESDRSCYILGEWWKGAAKNCTDAIFLAVGTGIGAGILTGGNVLRGAHGIAGAIGWMALPQPFDPQYIQRGCFETMASGEGIAKFAGKILTENPGYKGLLKNNPQLLTAIDVFDAYERGDTIAVEVVHRCVEIWGMAIANLVSLFNPQKIILGGGVFGPAVKFIPSIYNEAMKWAQPVSIRQVAIESSVLGADAGLFGAAYLAVQNLIPTSIHE